MLCVTIILSGVDEECGVDEAVGGWVTDGPNTPVCQTKVTNPDPFNIAHFKNVNNMVITHYFVQLIQ